MAIRRRDEYDGVPVATTTIAGEDYQKVIIADSTGSSASGPIAATQGVSTNVSVAATIAASNSSRKGGYIHFPASNTDNVYVSLNSPATTADMEHFPGSNFFLTLGYGGPPITNAVYGIAKSGTQKFILVQG